MIKNIGKKQNKHRKYKLHKQKTHSASGISKDTTYLCSDWGSHVYKGKIFAVGKSETFTLISNNNSFPVAFNWNPKTSEKLFTSVAFEKSQGKNMAVASIDGEVKIFNMSKEYTSKHTLEPISNVVLESHVGMISRLVFVPQRESHLLSGGFDWTVRLTDVESGKVVRQMEHRSEVLDLSINPKQPNVCVSTALEGSINVWDMREGGQTKKIEIINTPWNSVHAMPDGRTIVLGSSQGECRLYDFSRQVEQRNLKEKDDGNIPVQAITSSLDGNVIFVSQGKEVIAWNIAKKSKESDKLENPKQHTYTSLAISPDGTSLLGTSNKQISLWDTKK